MPLRIVQSKQNPRLKQLRKALAQPLRETGRNGRGLVGLEGSNLLGEALRSGLELECVFVAEGAEKLLEGLGLGEDTEILVMPREILAGALATESPQAVAALVYPPEWGWEDVLGGRLRSAPLVVVLAGLQDPGNLGTILRSAEAFGATGVVSLPGTVSAWNAKAVRASAGSVFRMPLVQAEAAEAIPQLHKFDVRLWAGVPERVIAADKVNLTGPVALMIGNEGNGVPGELLARADGLLTIPCPGMVESLNAAVAASVLLYEAARQRAAGEVGASHPSQKSRWMGHGELLGGGGR